ncbi:DUF6531 domain-containing protein (plasmid) [Moraxella bovis]|uniref:DUF6531 domain-containing protein n=1 Tax=Moraxella bovis TaxID=476 RepID=A0ABY6MAX6_MORBO|nr:RHS repeat-associated core domain-containing protein [Moraxella bovis]UZA04736.1 DUF6531 domain-containing protein [Moraxella bovis]
MIIFKSLMFNLLVWVIIVCVLLTHKTYANTCPFHSNISNNTGKSSSMCYANVDYQGTHSDQYHSDYPVNLLSGNKHLTETDIYPQNVNQQIRLEFTRYYNSMSSYKGMLGYGWRTIYEPQLLDRGNTLSLIQPDGTQFHFHLSSDIKDGYKTDRYISNNPEYGYFTKTSKEGLTEWQWYRPSSQRFTFVIDSRHMTAKETLGKLSKIIANYREPNSDYIQVIYDKNHRIAQVVDNLGQKLIFNYQNKKVILRLNDTTHTYHQDDKHNLIGYKDSEGNAFNYHYDNKEFPHSITKKTLISDDETQILGNWRYDDKGRVDYEELPHKKKSLTIVYDSNAPTSKQDIAYENGTKYYTTTTINGLGEVTKYVFTITNGFYKLIDKQYENCQNCDDLSMQKTDRQGNVSERTIGDTTYFYTYDNQSRLTLIEIQSKDTPKQWQQKRQYNGDDRVPSQIIRPSTAPDKEHTLSITYNQYGQPTYIKEVGYRNRSNGTQKIVRDYRYEYKLINGKSKLIAFDGALVGEKDKIHYHYDNKGKLIAVHYPNNLSQTIQYDELGRIAKFTDLDNLIHQYQYDTKGNIIKSDEAGKVRHIQYNAFGKPSKITDDSGQTLIYHYDESGVLIGLSDDKSTRIEFVRDVENNLVSAKLRFRDSVIQNKDYEVSNNVNPQFLDLFAKYQEIIEMARPNVQNSYKVLDNWITNTPKIFYSKHQEFDNNSNLTHYSYDDFGNMIFIDSPTTGLVDYDYDLNNNLIAIKSQIGTESYVRDDLGRIVKIAIKSQNKTQVHTISWGQNHRPSRITYPNGEENFSYNEQGKLISYHQKIDGKEFAITYEYDDFGRVKYRKLPSGKALKFNYNNQNNDKVGVLNGIYLSGLWDKPIIKDLNRDLDNPTHQSFVFGNGVKNILQKDSFGRVVLAGNPMIGQSLLKYQDNLNEPSQINHISKLDIGSRVNDKFSYRLQDSLGLSNQVRLPNEPTVLGDTNNSLSWRNHLPVYDEKGRIITQGSYSYEYDSQDQLTAIYKNDELNKKQLVATYRYNTFNQRIAKTVHTAGKHPKTTYYFYDGNQLVAEMSDDKLKEYVWLNQTPIAVLENGDIYFIHTDHRNAPIAVSDETSKMVWQASVEDFGYTTVHHSSQFELNLRFSNQYYDKESGLHYNTRRYYNPYTHRYLSPDPMGLAVGDDLYAFALNQPHSMADSEGLCPNYHQRDVAQWTQMEKLNCVFSKTAEHFNNDVGQALRELVSPQAIATTTAVFSIWALSHATPYGWMADLAMAGIGGLFVGKAVIDVIQGLYKVAKIFDSKCNLTTINEAVEALRSAIRSGTQALVGGAVTGPVATTRVAKLFRNFFSSRADKREELKIFADKSVGFHGTFVHNRRRKAEEVNKEGAAKRNQIAPWATGTFVADEWLNPGEKVYMLINKGQKIDGNIELGGWTSKTRFKSVAEARKRLAITEEFKKPHECCDLIEMTIKSPIPVRSGTAGGQVYNGKVYQGGGQQYELLVNFNKKKGGIDYVPYFDIKKLEIKQ